LAAFVGTTQAQERKKQDRPRLDAAFFERMDTNKDGVVTLDELPEERRERAKQLIERLDADKDGKLTRKEFDAAVDQVRPRGDSPNETRRPGRPEGTPPEGQRRPQEPNRPGDQPAPGQPPGPGQGGRPPFGLGGPDLFRTLDTDSDGKLSKDELAKAVEALMKHDKNGDGQLTPDELADGIRGPGRPGEGRPAGVPGAPGEGPGRVVEGMIQRADKNSDGKLSKDEVPELLRGRFDEIDGNKDGFLDREELVKNGERIRERMREQGGPPGGLPGRPGAGAPGAAPGRPSGDANLGANRERVAATLREHDKDADGRISPQEFGEDRAEQFKRIDANADAYLTPDEISRSLGARDRDQSAGERRRPGGSADKKDEPKKEEPGKN
jgi:Ca2+-binding EF-hand superfamily protein